MTETCPYTGEPCPAKNALKGVELSARISDSGKRGLGFVMREAFEILNFEGNCNGFVEDNSRVHCGHTELPSVERLVHGQADFIGISPKIVQENFSFTNK